MATTKDLGIVTAYGYALSAGYQGTAEEFAEAIKNYAEAPTQEVLLQLIRANVQATDANNDGNITLKLGGGA